MRTPGRAQAHTAIAHRSHVRPWCRLRASLRGRSSGPVRTVIKDLEVMPEAHYRSLSARGREIMTE